MLLLILDYTENIAEATLLFWAYKPKLRFQSTYSFMPDQCSLTAATSFSWPQPFVINRFTDSSPSSSLFRPTKYNL